MGNIRIPVAFGEKPVYSTMVPSQDSGDSPYSWQSGSKVVPLRWQEVDESLLWDGSSEGFHLVFFFGNTSIAPPEVHRSLVDQPELFFEIPLPEGALPSPLAPRTVLGVQFIDHAIAEEVLRREQELKDLQPIFKKRNWLRFRSLDRKFKRQNAGTPDKPDFYESAG